ncbi:MAG: NYN domain-containing protein [Actinomycetota bacterium]|nr:NYN domain-containing protein [Actinomycetota bacterium]
MQRLVVDGMNVIGSRPDGWWRDRDAAVRRLLGGLQRLAAASGQAVTLVVDGRPLPDVAEGEHRGVKVLYAQRSGADAADDRIVETVATDGDPGSLQVVTADRALRERVQGLGADVAGPQQLLSRLP